MRLILELIRIVLIMLVSGVVLGGIARSIYSAFEVPVGDGMGWLPGIAILLLLFVWYRNQLQFTGFYKSSQANKKLPKTATGLMIFISIILFAFPLLLDLFTRRIMY